MGIKSKIAPLLRPARPGLFGNPFAMHRHFLRRLFLGVLIAAVGLATDRSACAQVAGEGTSFTLVVPRLAASDGVEQEFVRLLLSSESGADVTLTWTESGFSRSVSVPPAGGVVEVLDTLDLVLPDRSGVFGRTLLLESDRPMTASVLLDRGTASEGFGLVPHDLLGFSHVVIAGRSEADGSYATVAAIEDGTVVEIVPSVATLDGNPPGMPFSIRLDRGEVYQLRSVRRLRREDDDDLSGSLITADRPVSVLAGSTCRDMPVGNTPSCNPLAEVIPPLSSLGREHLFIPFPDEQTTFLRMVAACGHAT